jgi:heme/copper-type cytochrome/quinol oxidase subunit 3
VALVLSFIPCINWFAFFPAVAGLICSIIGLATAKKGGNKKGLAIAGLVMSIVTIIWIPLFYLVFLAGVASSVAPLL